MRCFFYQWQHYVSYTKTGTGIHATYTPTYHFYMKDHLGSNRVVASTTGEAEQVNHYYPYGSTFYVEKPSDQRFKYCGRSATSGDAFFLHCITKASKLERVTTWRKNGRLPTCRAGGSLLSC